MPLADPDDLARAGRFLPERGIYVTLAFYPGVSREEVGFRVQVTAANTDDEVTQLLAALDGWPMWFRCEGLRNLRPP